MLLDKEKEIKDRIASKLQELEEIENDKKKKNRVTKSNSSNGRWKSMRRSDTGKKWNRRIER